MRQLTLVLFIFISTLAVAQTEADFAPITQSLGRTGKLQDGVYKLTFPRSDLRVRIGETIVEPAAGLTSWMAFRKVDSGFITDGDLVLTANELNPVISALQDGGLEVTGIHNHLIGEEPQVMYVHFFGQGDPNSLAQTLKAAIAETQTPSAVLAAPASSHPFANQKEIERVMGKAGTVNGKVLAFAFPRSSPISMHHQTLPPAMGMATAINLQPAPKGVAATGDFVLLEKEVNPVVKSLRKDGIMVTAMHNHLLDDEPRMVFVHFWAEGSAETVAAGLRHALDSMSK